MGLDEVLEDGHLKHLNRYSGHLLNPPPELRVVSGSLCKTNETKSARFRKIAKITIFSPPQRPARGPTSAYSGADGGAGLRMTPTLAVVGSEAMHVDGT